MYKKRLARYTWWALLFFCAFFQLGLLVIVRRILPRYAIPITAVLYLLSLAHLLFITFAGGAERARVLLAGTVLISPLFGGMFCLVFGMLHHARPPLVPPLVLPCGKSDAVYFGSGKAYFDALAHAISNAKQYVYLEYYIFEEGALWNQLLAVLREAARRGVRVDLVADGFGSADFLRRSHVRALAEVGITVHSVRPFALPLSFAHRIRDHRKLAVVDGEIAFFGGFNVADEYLDMGHRYGRFKDCGCAITGDAVRIASRMRFTAHSSMEVCGDGGAVKPFSAATGSPLTAQTFLRLCSEATSSVVIATPYFVPSDALLSALLLACRRGVSVTLLLPAKPDHPLVFRASLSYLRPLLACGARVYTYTPGFLHSKLMLVDDGLALVGSANWDIRSLSLNAENGVLLTAPQAVDAIRLDLATMQRESQEQRLTTQRRVLAPVSALMRFLAPLF